MKPIIRSLISLSIFISFTACRQPIDEMVDAINDAGYIAYKTPLAYAGPGTLVGGSPDRLSLVSPPQTCFPQNLDGFATDLYREDRTSLPQTHRQVSVEGEARVKLIDFLGGGNPVVGAGVKFSHVKKVSLTMEGIHIEYLDSIRLVHFYRELMDADCRAFLNDVGFIIQGMKVDKLSFAFYQEDGGKIEFDAESIKDYLDIGLDVEWEVVNSTTLEITSPKFIGYQLGRLRFEDKGMALYRASQVKQNTFIFEHIGLFNPKGMSVFADFSELPEELKTDQYSIYLD